ncbi:SDR family NAD(P)-dependent oxidoreductase [Hydrogenimonas thermophila]|uniref:SDR family oxidoreductase n=1 Tax=Hydrogenimonas thermophila TaxID=223786 RepID=UPI002936D9BD|nr:SDR family NAD(P)-dependent oxidoreductase [Hydrogenimonas thermophila]WOE69614.1 SDR family NAD(P)-dependent oxidoreductase [Hydrogenimonas thermophila]WOE72128.1 SDR family NAD(P)-dependent oxidoreductase [Hydrogenimonas thermophila]
MKKVLITGSTGAIGEACARYFHNEGYFVYLHYRNGADKAKELKTSLENSETIQFDITDKESVRNALENIEVDVLVNNAGITKDNLFFWMSDEEWNSVIDTSINGTYYVTKALMKSMISNKSGAIVNVASVSGIVGNAGQTNYSAAKGAMIAFTKALSAEVARYNIRVNAVAPGLIASEMTKDLPLKDMKKSIPMQRIGKPEEVAECVFFLADKATYVTGEVLNISGGMVR